MQKTKVNLPSTRTWSSLPMAMPRSRGHGFGNRGTIYFEPQTDQRKGTDGDHPRRSGLTESLLDTLSEIRRAR
jgi:hypothetical protein